MPVTIKSEREINLMREAGKILARVHEELAKEVKAGMSSYEIDKICEEIIRSYDCIPRNIRSSHVNHRLNCQCHSRLKFHSSSLLSEVWVLIQELSGKAISQMLQELLLLAR